MPTSKSRPWAEIERDNHQKAHPDYKFTPSKPAAKPTKSPTQSRFDQSDGSDLDDLDWASSGIPGHGGVARAASYNHMRSTTKTPADELDDYYGGGNNMYGPPHGYHTHAHTQLTDIRNMGMGTRSAYEFAPTGKALSSQYDPRDISAAGQYYETTRLQHNPRQLPHGMIEDAMISSGGGAFGFCEVQRRTGLDLPIAMRVPIDQAKLQIAPAFQMMGRRTDHRLAVSGGGEFARQVEQLAGFFLGVAQRLQPRWCSSPRCCWWRCAAAWARRWCARHCRS